MEMNSQPQRFTYTDVFAEIDRDDLRRQIILAEFDLPDATDENDRILESEVLEKLDEELGFGEEEVSSVYTGLAYKVDKHGLPILREPKMFADKELKFCGTGYHDIEGKWRILFEFRDTSIKKTPTYVTAFDAMVRLAITESANEKYDVNTTLRQHTEMSKILISDPGFYTVPVAEQMEKLKGIAMSCDRVLRQKVDTEDISVEAPMFYIHPDSKDEDQFTVTCVDQTHENFEDRTAVVGDMIGVIYLEACLDPERKFTGAKDFFIGGVPCIVIRNEKAGTTCYVPISQIESIEKNS